MSSDSINQAFNKRLKPCQRCKVQRRKCDRASETADCYRCIKSNRDCIYDDGTGDTGNDIIDGNKDLQKLTQTVAGLQESLQRMEVYLQQERSIQTHSNATPPWIQPELSPSCSTIWSSTCSVYINNSNSPMSSPQLSAITAPTSNLTSSIRSNGAQQASAMDEEKEYEWILTFVDGKLRLDSTIRSSDELTAYSNALRQYLSPFAGVFNNTAFLFETIQPKSIVPMVIQVVSQGFRYQQRPKLLTRNSSMWNKYHFMLKRHHPAVILAAAGKEPPISCIDELVDHYFTCYNPGLPLIHAPTYLAEYETIVRPNPTQHALTMALLCCKCASTCRHIPFDNYERRILADYFYDRAVDLLGDFFDDPDRRLETLMVINFLSQYQQITLRIMEARKWCHIGYMLAKELHREYEWNTPLSAAAAAATTTSSSSSSTAAAVSEKEPPSSPYSVASAVTSASASSPLSSSSSSTSPSTPVSTAIESDYSTSQRSLPTAPAIDTPPLLTDSDNKYLSKLSPITTDRDFAIFRRHYVMSLCAQKLLNLIVDRNPQTWELLSSKPLLYLEDECEMTLTFIGVYNKSLQLMTHPVVLELKEQTHRMQLGERAKVTLELILRFDQVYQDWWKSLPPEFRLCDQDPADVSCRPYIEKCPSQLQLIVYLLAVIHKAEANIALTKPSNQSTISEDTNHSLLRAIQERALNDAYECVESLVMALKRLEVNKVYCIFTSDLLLWVSDLMCTLSASSSVSVKDRAQERLAESLHQLRMIQFMEGNIVPPALSPLAFMYSAENSASTTTPSPMKPEEVSVSIMEMYNEYTLPSLAFGYDILRMASEVGEQV